MVSVENLNRCQANSKGEIMYLLRETAGRRAFFEFFYQTESIASRQV